MRLIPPIRLSTAVLLMFVSGGWIWLNTFDYSSVENESYMVGVKGYSERWEETKNLSTGLQNDSPLRPGFTLLKFPAVYETRTRLVVSRGKGFPCWITPWSSEGKWSKFRYFIGPLIVNALVGFVLLWNIAVLTAYCFPLEEKKK